MFRINVTETTWRLVVRHVEAEIERIRDKLEKPTDDDKLTERRRGQIEALRALLKDLPNKDFSQGAE